MSNRNYISGRAFEYRVMKKFWSWPYVKRHYGSKGIADIVAVRNCPFINDFPDVLGGSDTVSHVVFIQCKYSRMDKAHTMLSKIDRKALIDYSVDCGATPIFAYSKNRRVVLINLLTNMGFIP